MGIILTLHAIDKIKELNASVESAAENHVCLADALIIQVNIFCSNEPRGLFHCMIKHKDNYDRNCKI